MPQANTTVKQLSHDQITSFEHDGFLILRDVLGASDTRNLQQWAEEVYSWPNNDTAPWMPYEEVNADGKRVLCRTENYANSHTGFDELLRGAQLRSILEQLVGEEMILFKEKINYKLAGSGGFAPHIDAVAYKHVKDIKHVTILMAVDPSNMNNGGLEVVVGSHKIDIPLAPDNCIDPIWVQAQQWTPVILEPGEILIFGSYLAHRSGPNRSSSDRKNIYATYNRAAEGELHAAYYEARRTNYPATHMRKQGEQYDEGTWRYAFGSPMLSAHIGKQVEF